MPRQSQNAGLQVAVCLFAMLTVVLGVSTFVMSRRAGEADGRRQAAEADAHRNRLALAQGEDENRELKRLLGFGPHEQLSAIQAQFARDMQPYAAGLAPQDLFYRPVLAYLQDRVNRTNAELVGTAQERQSLGDALVRQEGTAAVRIDRQAQSTAQANSDRREIEHAAAKDLARLTDENRDLQATAVRVRKALTAAQVAAEEKQSELQRQLRATLKELQQCKDQLASLNREDPAAAQGTLRDVSYALRTVLIDLGYADALHAMVPFDVYAASAARLAPDGRKGRIEVTRVLETHLAEARMVSQKETDPLIPGDKIRSTTWLPGQK